MASEKRTWQQLSTSSIVAIGIALVWGLLAGWGISVVYESLWPTNKTNESIAITTAGMPIISTRTWQANHYYRTTYRTLDDQPATVRRGELLDEVSLLRPGQSVPKPAQMVMAGLIAPIPLGWIVGGGIFGPLMMVQENKVPNYSAGLRKVTVESWPGLIIPTLLALASAGLALRLHRHYHRQQLGLWWLFVFLLGPAGLLAYWLEHHRPPLEECPACGRTVPRDRDDCAACAEAFAPPALVGTEIFA